MGVWKNIRMRCAFRYLFCTLVLILTFISIQLALMSDRSAHFLRGNFFAKRVQMDLFSGNTLNSGVNNLTLSKLVSDSMKHFKEFSSSRRLPVKITWQEYRSNPSALTGNPLIDDYGKNDPSKMGENGSGVILVGEEKEKAVRLISKYNVNVYASDHIPFNRMVPDSRFPGYGFHTCIN